MGIDKVFIIAELSANHNNDFKLAADTIKAMAKSGADAVKIQTFKADSFSMDVDNEYFGPRKDGLWKGRRPFELFKEASMPYEWQPELKRIAEDLGLIFFSSPFDKEGVDFLEDIGVSIYKIASLEITDIPLIKYVASKCKPIILSTGIAELSDIELAVKTCRKEGNDKISILKCTSAYPTPFEEVNLKVIPNLKETFGVEVGISDHTMGSTVPIGAVALGAKIVEKHFILDRSKGGVDAAFSMEPHEFKQMVDAIRDLEKALGSINYNLTPKMKEIRLRGRSLFVSKDVIRGEIISEENIKSVRPATGLHPKYYSDVIGRKFNFDLKKGTPLSWDYISKV